MLWLIFAVALHSNSVLLLKGLGRATSPFLLMENKYGFFLKSNPKPEPTHPKGVGFWNKLWGTTWESKKAYELEQMKAKNDKLSEANDKLKAKNLELKEEISVMKEKENACVCGFESKSKHGLNIHKGSCERTRSDKEHQS